MKTLKEVQNIVGLERRTIQELEKAKLAIKPTHVNKYGYLLYGESEIERLWQLRFYKELGYNIPKIRTIMHNKDYDLQKELDIVICSLKEKRKDLDNMIAIAEVMKSTGASLNSIRNTWSLGKELDANGWFNVFGKGFSISLNARWDEFINEDAISEELMNEIIDECILICADCDNGLEPSCSAVQKRMQHIHLISKELLSESVMVLQLLAFCLEPDGELVKELSSEVSVEHIAYIREVILVYCDLRKDNYADKKYNEAFDNIERLGRQKYTTKSLEVQTEVEKIHKFFKHIALFSEKGAVGILKIISEWIGSDSFIKYMDNDAKRGIAWFISRAIEIYCNGLDYEQKEE